MGAPLRKTRFLLSLLLSVFRCLAAAQAHSWVLEEYKAEQVNATHPLLIWTIIQGTSEKSLNKPGVHCKLLLSLWTGCWQGWTSLSWLLSLLRVNAAAPGMTVACGWDHFAPSSSVSTSISTPFLSVSADNPIYLNIYSNLNQTHRDLSRLIFITAASASVGLA